MFYFGRPTRRNDAKEHLGALCNDWPRVEARPPPPGAASGPGRKVEAPRAYARRFQDHSQVGAIRSGARLVLLPHA